MTVVCIHGRRRHGAITQGFLQGEILRRVTGRSMGTFFHDEVAQPLGADFHIGLPAELDDRVAELIPPDMAPSSGENAPTEIAMRTFQSCDITGTEPQSRDWRGAERPSDHAPVLARFSLP